MPNHSIFVAVSDAGPVATPRPDHLFDRVPVLFVPELNEGASL
jgi:hypothetical protein